MDLIAEVRLVEPDQPDRTAPILDHRFEDLHPLPRRYMRLRGEHLAAKQYRFVDVPPDLDDARRVAPVLVAVREEPEEIADRFDAVGRQRLRAPFADAFEELHRRAGAHAIDCAPCEGSAL